MQSIYEKANLHMTKTSFFGEPTTPIVGSEVAKLLSIITTSERRDGETRTKSTAAASILACARYIQNKAGTLEAVRILDKVRFEVIDHG
jgi:hypothetical protein